MNLSEKLLTVIQAKYNDSGSIARSALIGMSSEVNADILSMLMSNADRRIRDKDDAIVPVVLIAPPEQEIKRSGDGLWRIPFSDDGYESEEDARVAYRDSCQKDYQVKGWGRGWQDFAVKVRNIPDAPVVYLATSRGDLNASVDSAIVTFGFLPTPNEGDGCGYFLSDAFYLGLLPDVGHDRGKSWPDDYVKSLRPIYDELADPNQAWSLLKILNAATDVDGQIKCSRLEAILGLPNSGQERFTVTMLSRQISLVNSMASILSSPEKNLFYERLKAELPGQESLVDQFAEYIQHKSAAASIEDSMFITYSGRARILQNESFCVEPWWEPFTVALLERVLTMPESISSSFSVKALDAVAGEFKDKRMPLIGKSSMEFAFSMDESEALVTVSRSTKIMETDIPIDSTFVYQATNKDVKSFRLNFEARVDNISKAAKVQHDVIMLDTLDAGCFVTIGDSILLKKAGAFVPYTSKAKHRFKSCLVASKESSALLQLFIGSQFELDENSVIIRYEGIPTSEKLSVDTYDKYLGIRCDLRDAAEILFSGKVNGKKTTYTVEIEVDAVEGRSYPTEFNLLTECHLNHVSPTAEVSFGSSSVSSRLSQDHISAVKGVSDLVVGYPLLIADDIDSYKNNVWLESYHKATKKVFQTVDPRPQVDAWKKSCECDAAGNYFLARKNLFALLTEHNDFGGNVVEEYRLSAVDAPANENVRVAMAEYLTAYNAWLEIDYDNAVVVDTIWVYLCKSNSLGARPDVILLPPQHPVRLFWQYQAQRYMRDLLCQNKVSNIVSSFDSHSVPDMLYIPMQDSTTGKMVKRAYFAIPTSSDYWGAYHSYDPVLTPEVLEVSPFFKDWGFEITSVKRTMSAGEVESAISATQSVCIAKDALNVRYIAKNMGGSSARLLLQQGVTFLNGKDDSGPKFGPRVVSIIGPQASKTPEGVTEAEIMKARERTSGRLQWYTETLNERHRLKVDVTIASLGAANISPYYMGENPSCGVVCAGGLLRYHNRCRGVAAASEIVESRCTHAAADVESHDADNLFLRTLDILEGESRPEKNLPGHVRFNADIVGAGIMRPNDDSSHYYAISSSDVDQACFEALSGNSGVYLWEYRLPMPGAHSGGTDGFYLLARENATMIQAVSEAVKSLNAAGASNDDIRKMLFLSAKRGIPTVKNLASGGKSALGEVGVLVTLNMLQGTLQDDACKGILPAHMGKDGFEYFNILVPMDVFKERFESLVREVLNKNTPTRPDVVCYSIKCKQCQDGLEPVRMRLSFIEVKTRRDKMPSGGMEDALKQADCFRELYLVDDSSLPLLSRWAKVDFLIGMLTFGFRVYESIRSMLNPLVAIYPKVLSALFERPDFLEVNPLPRLVVIHSIACSKPSMEKDCVYQAIEISKTDGYDIAIGGEAPEAIKAVGTWGLLPDGEMPDSEPKGSDVPILKPSLTNDVSDGLQGGLVQVTQQSVTREESGVDTQPSTQALTSEGKQALPAVNECQCVDLEEKYSELLQKIKEAFEDFGIETKRLAAPVETPNLILIDYKGTKTCTENKVAHYKKEFKSTYSVELERVETRTGVVRLVLLRAVREVLFLDEIWARYAYDNNAAKEKGLLIAVEEDSGEAVYLNPQKEASPHTLVAGMTGSGKSVLLLNMLYCLRDRFSNDDVQVYIMDPKQVDFIDFEDISNFTVVQEKVKAIEVFNGLVDEMNQRLKIMHEHKVKKIGQYNALPNVTKMPIIWCFHDEFPDWFMDDEYQKAIGVPVSSLTAKARAAGIFLVFAAQRPEAAVMPAFMRSNFGLRLVLKVSDPGTSAIALGDAKGFAQANDLLGKGHMIAVLTEKTMLCQVPNIKGLD